LPSIRNTSPRPHRVPPSFPSVRVSPDQLGAWAAAPSSSSVSVRRRARWQAATQMSLGFVSELCQIPPETPVRHRDLRGHVDAHRCCGKSLIRSALVGFGVRQHARRESISKRARSTTPTSLRFRINNLWSLNVLDSANCDKSSNVSRSLTGFSSIKPGAGRRRDKRSRCQRRSRRTGLPRWKTTRTWLSRELQRAHNPRRSLTGCRPPGDRLLPRERSRAFLRRIIGETTDVGSVLPHHEYIRGTLPTASSTRHFVLETAACAGKRQPATVV